jgi:adenosylcobinamide-phosphate synthase
MLEIAYILFFGFLLDISIGDPRYRFHPIRIIGQAISILEKIMWKFGLNGRGGGEESYLQ